MTLNELIKEKDYDRIEFRILYNIRGLCEKPQTREKFYGLGYSKQGKFYSADGDNYDEELTKELVSFSEWENPKKNIKNGLTVVYDFSENTNKNS